jgi:hypothetical protein
MTITPVQRGQNLDMMSRADRLYGLGATVAGRTEAMSKFKVKVARIEAAGGKRADSQVCITFAITRGSVGFQVPIHLKVGDYDDTEMVRAARSALHEIFVELSQHTRPWKLSAKELRLLADMNLRPTK